MWHRFWLGARQRRFSRSLRQNCSFDAHCGGSLAAVNNWAIAVIPGDRKTNSSFSRGKSCYISKELGWQFVENRLQAVLANLKRHCGPNKKAPAAFDSSQEE